MRASARFQAALRQSHATYEYVDVTGPTNQTIRLSTTQGSVTVDRTSQFRRSTTITCIDPTGTVTPSNSSSILTPYGTMFTPYRGILYPDGTNEVYPLGVYGLSEVTVDESNPMNGSGTTIQIQGYDKARKISRQKFLTAYTIPAGTLITTAIMLLVQLVYPDCQFNMVTHGMTTPYVLTYAAGDDPWQACMDLGASIGCQVFFDAYGTCVVNQPVDIDALGSPAWDYIEGQGCTMTDISAVYTDDPGYNGVILTGANTGTTGTAVSAAVWDMEPSSPTYRYGPYGEVPYFVQDTNITTNADALVAANATLKMYLGFCSELDITCWTNPALEVDDVIQVERSTVHATGLYLLDSFVVPLGGASQGGAAETEQTLVVRQQRNVGA